MWKTLMLVSFVGLCFISCDLQKERTAQLKAKVDSLSVELQANQNAMQTLQEVGVLMDSIDATRFVLKTRMVEGTSFNDYTERMVDINKYVKEAHDRIVSLEEKVRSMSGSTSSYSGTIKRLKGDLEKRMLELAELKETVAKYRNENDNLIQTVTLQEAELADKLDQLKNKETDVVRLQNEVSDLLVKSKFDEAESYYARAVAVEETARRTHLAPRKKKNTRKEALELYKLAVFYGKEEAQVKVTELEEKI
jgi:chromosome segregation ATPase